MASTNIKTFLIRAPQSGSGPSFVEPGKVIKRSAIVFRDILSQLHDSLQDDICAFEVVATHQSVSFSFTADETVCDIATSLIYSVLPHADIVEINDPFAFKSTEADIASAELKLAYPQLIPLKNFSDFEADSLTGLLNTLSKLPMDARVYLQFILKPVKDDWKHQIRLKSAMRKVRFFAMTKPQFWAKPGLKEKTEILVREKSKERLYRTNIRVSVLSYDKKDQAKKILKSIKYAFSSFNAVDLNQLKFIESVGSLSLKKLQNRDLSSAYLMSCNELSTLYHLPSEKICPDVIRVISHREPAPKELPTTVGDPNISFFGSTNYRSQNVPFGIDRGDRRRHLYVLGKSGVGKSKLMELLIKNDIDSGHGVGILDPHGDLVDNVLTMIPEHRIKDVVLFDPSDIEYPPSFNPLEHVPDEFKIRVTIGFIEIFKKLFGTNWSPRLEHVLRYTTLALLDTPGTTVLSILKMLTDKKYRQAIVKNIKDDVVKNFWVNEFAGWSEKFDNEAITPLLNKVGQFVSTNMIRHIVGQPDNLFDFRKIMDEKKILLMKVSKGILGEENSSLLGAMAITKIYQSAMSRANILEKDRVDFYFYVDEFQNFATDTFDEILSEARKYRLNLTIANQFLGQLNDNIRKTVFGNTGSVISFRIGGEDAGIMEEEFDPRFKRRDLINLGVREFVTKMSIRGETFEAFSGRTLTMHDPAKSYVQECVKYSRENYALPLEKVKEVLSKWDESSPDDYQANQSSISVEEEVYEEPMI